MWRCGDSASGTICWLPFLTGTTIKASCLTRGQIQRRQPQMRSWRKESGHRSILCACTDLNAASLQYTTKRSRDLI